MYTIFPYVFYAIAFAGGIGLVTVSAIIILWSPNRGRGRVFCVSELLLSLIFGVLIALDYGVKLLGVRVPGAFHAVISVAIFIDSLALIALYLRRGRIRAREAVEAAR